MTASPSRWCLLLLGFGFAPLMAVFFNDLWKQPEYQFFPQALAAASFLAWDRLREVPRPMSGGTPFLTIAFLSLSFVLLGLALLLWSPWLAIVSSLVATVAVLWRTGGPALLRKMGPALCMVVTVIPPPLGLEQRLGIFLRGLATEMSSRTLDLLGVIHCVSGNVIDLPRQKLLVEEACSGINSVLFVTAFTVFYLFWRRRSFLVFLFCLPASLAFVLAGNIVRISLGAWLIFFHGIDILTGWKHEMQSVFLTVIYIVLVVSLESLLPRRKSEPPTLVPPCRESRPPRQTSSLKFQAACCLFAVLGVLSMFKGWDKWNEKGGLQAANSALKRGAVFSLPDRIGDWRRIDAGPPKISKIETLGLSSAIWNYQRPGMRAVVAFDYPIASYHDVEECYAVNGWFIENKELYVPGNGAPPRFQMNMKKEPDISATAWFSTINEKGEWVDQAIVERYFITRLGLLGSQQETTYRVQLLLPEKVPVDPEGYKAVAELFEAASATLSRQMLEQIR